MDITIHLKADNNLVEAILALAKSLSNQQGVKVELTDDKSGSTIEGQTSKVEDIKLPVVESTQEKDVSENTSDTVKVEEVAEAKVKAVTPQTVVAIKTKAAPASSGLSPIDEKINAIARRRQTAEGLGYDIPSSCQKTPVTVEEADDILKELLSLSILKAS